MGSQPFLPLVPISAFSSSILEYSTLYPWAKKKFWKLALIKEIFHLTYRSKCHKWFDRWFSFRWSIAQQLRITSITSIIQINIWIEEKIQRRINDEKWQFLQFINLPSESSESCGSSLGSGTINLMDSCLDSMIYCTFISLSRQQHTKNMSGRLLWCGMKSIKKMKIFA